MKIYNSLFISYTSLKGEKALSGYITEFSSFNVFDEDIVEKSPKKEKVKKIQFEGIDNNDINLTVNP